MIGALSNTEALASLLRLDRMRAKLLAGAAKAQQPAVVLKPRNGVVQAAILEVLSAASAPMAPVEIHALVERSLGHAVVRDTVSSFLSVACRAENSSIIRVQRGLYRLAQ